MAIDASEPEARSWGGRSGEALGAGFIPRSVEIRNRDEDTQSNNPLYGIPFNVVHGNSVPKVTVVIDGYPSESDVQPAPIPADAVLEGDNQNGPVVGLANRGDSHLIVWDEDNNIAYEFYQASRPSENSDGLWHAAQETVWNMNTDTFRTLGWTSADAAGLAILPGLVRPDEVLPASQGGQGAIDHAIRITLQNKVILNQFIYPASHVANPGNTNTAVQVPMGTRLRLKASVDISQLYPESQVIAKAMQDYDVIVADNGSNFFATGASYSVDANNNFAMTWNDNDIQDPTHGLKSLTYSDFEVVNLAPVVTGLSASSGSAGSTITVNGANFSGAAGHLQVFFGGTAATNVTVVDDSHVTAVVPAGTGTVDVTVQSGVTDPDPENINNPVFGYGTSAVTTADRFTYGGSTGNQAPTVAQPASATPNPVTATTTSLAVLGADDGGEASLAYTWQVTAAPTGASPIFSVNETNAAKNTVVTFNRAGAYTFRVTIADTGGLTATSTVSVTVNPVLSSIIVTPSSVTLEFRSRLSDHRLDAAMLDLEIGYEGGPSQQFPCYLWQNVRRESMAVHERLGVSSTQAPMGFGDLLASHLQEVQVLTRGDSRTQQRLPRFEVRLGLPRVGPRPSIRGLLHEAPPARSEPAGRS